MGSIAIVIQGVTMIHKVVDVQRWIGPKTMVIVMRQQRGMMILVAVMEEVMVTTRISIRLPTHSVQNTRVMVLRSPSL